MENRLANGGFLPGLKRLSDYSAETLMNDVVAGAILAVLLIPQAMAYALLADLPPQAGLYTAIAPAIVYALLGTSAQVSVGPVALASILVAGAIRGSSLPALEAAAIVGIEMGILLFVLGILRLGRLVNFVSDPALLGFTAAVAVLIAASQLPALLGIDVDRGSTIMGMVEPILASLGGISAATLALGIGALALILLGDRYGRALLWRAGLHPPWRTAAAKSVPLLVMILAAVVASTMLTGVETIQEPPGGLPPLSIPSFDMNEWLRLLPSAAIVAIVVFVTGTAVAKQLAGRRRQALDTSQEAIALGTASAAAAVTGGYVPGVSLSRSALAWDSGAKTPFASAIAGLIVLLVLLFFTAPLAALPRAALAALVMAAVAGLIKWDEIKGVFRQSKTEGGILVLTFLATLALGIQWGLAIGAALGIAGFLWFSSLPRVTRLGYQESAHHYRSVDRDDVEVNSMPVLVARIDRSLYFGNVGHCEDQLLELLSRHDDARCLLLDMKGVNDVDASGMAMLERLVSNLREKDLNCGFAVVRQPLKPKFARSLTLCECALFEDVEDGVDKMKEACRRDSKEDVDELLASDRVADY